MSRLKIKVTMKLRLALCMALATAIAIVACLQTSHAQSNNGSCANGSQLYTVKGKISPAPAPSETVQIVFFSANALGQAYMKSLQYAALPSPTMPPAPITPAARAQYTAAVTQRLQAQANMSLQVQHVTATMYQTTADSDGSFSCNALASGKYAVLAIREPQPPPTPGPAPTPKPTPAPQSAGTLLSKIYFYTSINVPLSAPPTPPGFAGTIASYASSFSPTSIYNPFVVHTNPFKPIANYDPNY